MTNRRLQLTIPESVLQQWEERRAESGIPSLSTWVVTQVQRPDTRESLSLILDHLGKALEFLPEEERWMIETLQGTYSAQVGSPVSFQAALRIAIRQAYGQVRPAAGAIHDVLGPADPPHIQ